MLLRHAGNARTLGHGQHRLGSDFTAGGRGPWKNPGSIQYRSTLLRSVLLSHHEPLSRTEHRASLIPSCVTTHNSLCCKYHHLFKSTFVLIKTWLEHTTSPNSPLSLTHNGYCPVLSWYRPCISSHISCDCSVKTDRPWLTTPPSNQCEKQFQSYAPSAQRSVQTQCIPPPLRFELWAAKKGFEWRGLRRVGEKLRWRVRVLQGGGGVWSVCGRGIAAGILPLPLLASESGSLALLVDSIGSVKRYSLCSVVLDIMSEEWPTSC